MLNHERVSSPVVPLWPASIAPAVLLLLCLSCVVEESDSLAALLPAAFGLRAIVALRARSLAFFRFCAAKSIKVATA